MNRVSNSDSSDTTRRILESYQKRAPGYNFALGIIDKVAWVGFDISGWRRLAISGLGLKRGDTVVDIGCGTGLNFALLQQAIGSQGKIIGVDLSAAMLSQARRASEVHGWTNVELVCADATEFVFPASVNAVLSTYALTLVPDPARVVSNAAEALVDGGRLVVLDMAWPRLFPLWWRHVLFFLRSYGVTLDVLKRRPWEAVQTAMQARLDGVTRRSFWFGFFYLAVGQGRDRLDGGCLPGEDAATLADEV